ncbi:M6 family metalloprotease domain-containing protein [Flavisolibacter nicotianae]|uniref:M6 family metalloprotease domain-containing protein n=1 Tax=Flavisolibacter nicotianae TaxID=2364882 RepID=UPI000EB32E26|nr:M6 family metalloprotease domain-containing protein [Flavisolibacter nicotianae]
MRKKIKGSVEDLLAVYKAAAASNDGERCLISPSPEVREMLKRDLARMRNLASDNVLSNLLTSKQETRVGFNDGLIMPGNVFPLGTSAMAVRTHASRRSPLRGAIRVAVVLVDFPDKKITQTKKHYEELFFSDKSGSVRDYYKEVTGKAVSIEGQVIGPITLPRKLREYANGASGTGSAQPNARTMAEDAAKIAVTKMDFSKYDNDGNGYVDAFVVIHAGRGAEETASKWDIWSHKWLLPKVFNAGTVNIYAYLTVPEDCKLGVCAHELGHLLFGFPDLYDTDYSSEGVGDWCLMGGGSWNGNGNTPAHPCAWCKAQQGWAMVINQVKNEDKVKIDPVQKSKTVYRLWKGGILSNEYFLVENREQKNYDKFIPGGGLLIWHIDDSIDGNSNELHYRVALMQADGNKDLESGNNRGDDGDCYPGVARNKSFTKSSVPNSLSYGNVETGVQVNNIRKSGATVHADLYVSAQKAKAAKAVKAAQTKSAAKKKRLAK